MEKEKATKTGFGIGTVLFLIFLTLKLAEIGSVAKWSWWWVTAPLWGQVVLIVGIIILYIVFGILGIIFKAAFSRKKKDQKSERPKSRFEQRLDEMKKQREEALNGKHNQN